MAHPEAIYAWRPAIGDPTLLGWIAAAGYLGTAWLCWRARRMAPAPGIGRLWGALALGLVALGINKQLDFQSYVIEVGRAVAHRMDWHEGRRALQVGFTGVVVLLVLGSCLWLARQARAERARATLACVGWVLLCLFATIRAASFQHLDRFLGTRRVEPWMIVTLELGGVALIAVGALSYRRGGR